MEKVKGLVDLAGDVVWDIIHIPNRSKLHSHISDNLGRVNLIFIVFEHLIFDNVKRLLVVLQKLLHLR